MNLPFQLVFLTIPSLIFIGVNRIRKRDWDSILSKIGWKAPPVKYLVIGLIMGFFPGLISMLIPNILPSEIMNRPEITQSIYSDWPLGVLTFFLAFFREAIYVALGEEVFFRGFLGGVLIRKIGFAIGNIIQSIIFLIPHLLLLTISIKLWPLVIVQVLSGWIYGWLFYKSGSILPSWLAHSLGNAFGAVMFMR